MTIDDTTEQKYEMYTIWCDDHKVKPTIRDFAQWADERYPE